MNDVTNHQDVSFLSNPDIWPSDKVRTLAMHLAHGRIFDPNEFEILAQEMYDIEERWAKIVWMERQTNACLRAMKESGVEIPMKILEKMPAFRPSNRSGEDTTLVS